MSNRWVRIPVAVLGVAVLVASLAAFPLIWWLEDLERRVESRFSGRTFDVPSRVYSGPALLYAGMDIERAGLEERLERLGYRRVEGPPARGQYRVAPGEVEVFRRRFLHSHGLDPGGRVTVRLDGRGRIASVRDASGRPQAALELEPELIANFRGEARRDLRLVELDDLPPHLIPTLLSVEDRDFYEHFGLKPWRIAGAAVANLRAGRIVEGGSTLTQQLVKNFYLSADRTLRRKLVEAVMALILERNHDKDEILEAYLNEIYMGQRGSVAVHGFGEAAFLYFGKELADLTVAESALLVGMIQGPNLLSPHRHPERALERRDLVLRVLHDEGHIDERTRDEALEAPLGVRELRREAALAPWFVARLRAELEAEYGPDLLQAEGLAVFTTLDPHLQRTANTALVEELARLEERYAFLRRPEDEPPLQAAVVALAPHTGEILALVGGRDWGSSQFDRATQALRQPGSVFKPIVALAALRRDTGGPTWTPASLLLDAPLAVELPSGTWEPQNYDGEFRGEVTLRDAVERSLNVPMARLGVAVGPERIIETARRMGVDSPLRPLPSIALGAFELTPLEAARTYAVLASGGIVPEVRSYSEVLRPDGVILERRDRDFRRAFDGAETWLVTSILQGAVDRGTAVGLRARGFRGPVAAKTGTTSDFRDAWIIGYTPDVVVAVWVGFDDGQSLGLPGSVAALPIFARVIEAAANRAPERGFGVPPGIETQQIDPGTGLLASARCPGREEFFLEGSAPDRTCEGQRPGGAIDRLRSWLERVL